MILAHQLWFTVLCSHVLECLGAVDPSLFNSATLAYVLILDPDCVASLSILQKVAFLHRASFVDHRTTTARSCNTPRRSSSALSKTTDGTIPTHTPGQW